MPSYFISDLHLEPGRPDLTAAFEAFLSTYCINIDALYILGDFVEAWIGDDNLNAFNLRLAESLKKISASGTAVFFMRGNRDFLLGERFAKRCGMTLLLNDEVIVERYGQTVLLLHGDQLCTDDTTYQAFRKRVRNPVWQQTILKKPLWIRRLIAAYMRFRSRWAQSKKDLTIMDVNEDAVVNTFKQFDVSTMIHGHTHRPNDHTLSFHSRDGSTTVARRIVLGDWETSTQVCRWDEQGLELIPIDFAKLQPSL